MLDAGIGQLNSVKIEILQLNEAAQVLQPLIGDQSAEQVQPAKPRHLCYGSKRVIQHIRVSQVERFEIDQPLEALRILDCGVVETQIFQLSQRRKPFDSLITDIEPRQG